MNEEIWGEMNSVFENDDKQTICVFFGFQLLMFEHISR